MGKLSINATEAIRLLREANAREVTGRTIAEAKQKLREGETLYGLGSGRGKPIFVDCTDPALDSEELVSRLFEWEAFNTMPKQRYYALKGELPEALRPPSQQ